MPAVSVLTSDNYYLDFYESDIWTSEKKNSNEDYNEWIQESERK